ncbi:hypothetical protein B0H66DRAFT_618173 [Apodospora peruviana]|uniref:DNA2/NAM7 helicase-like C-terminal domain-containing protein n=1 Tax=Apodospora peruviana TaxID=516989 RepID=A0AAE0IKK9_9PEZI|nr:hypothetical protein B0H66DRAFT_618173 [Apodospora peruviana]
MIDCLDRCPRLAVVFARLESRIGTASAAQQLATTIKVYAPQILKAYILSSSTMHELVVGPFKRILSQINKHDPHNIRGPDPHCISDHQIARCGNGPPPRVSRPREHPHFLPYYSDPTVVQHFVRCLIGIALDHIGEAAEEARVREDLFDLKLLPDNHDGYNLVEAEFRIDAKGGTPEQSAHVRLVAATPPSNVFLGRTYSMDALLHYLGLFATTKTMFDAVVTLATEQEEACGIADRIMGYTAHEEFQGLEQEDFVFTPSQTMNASQRQAILEALMLAHPKERILVAAPTHNAVDNVMRRYLQDLAKDNNRGSAPSSFPIPLRVSTEKAVLVGDHGQLRPTVQPHAAAQGFDVSLFERLYTAPAGSGGGAIKKVMLDTQYRMHETICKFSSDEFYNSGLKTDRLPPQQLLHLKYEFPGNSAPFLEVATPNLGACVADFGVKFPAKTRPH